MQLLCKRLSVDALAHAHTHMHQATLGDEIEEMDKLEDLASFSPPGNARLCR